MKHRYFLKGKNEGASLPVVLIIFIVVGVIAAIVTKMTLANINMREMEQSGKKNFYSAEMVLDDLSVGLNAAAADAMQRAYTAILTNYQDSTAGGGNLQEKFTELYMGELSALFAETVTSEKQELGKTVYAVGNYKKDAVKACFSTAANQIYYLDPADASFSVDYKEGIFTLKNVGITYQDDWDYATSLTTDMVFSTPSLNFENRNKTQEFMRYALVAEEQILVNAASVSVDGNVYAGAGGIVAGTGGSGTIQGNTVVTRGSILTESGSSLSIGSGSSKIWAENVETTGKGSPSLLELNGNCYIADDLTMKGKGSQVILKGNYYGYNFQKNYGAAETSVTDSSFSSAMMVNARDCNLNLEGLDYLLLAGRTYISRGSAGNISNPSDIMLGESLSVRTNQLAYYVPSNYLDLAAGTFTAEGSAAYGQDIGVPDFMNYLKASAPVTPYYYRDNASGTASVRYYLNFESEQKANEFYGKYTQAQTSGSQRASAYVSEDALVLDSSTIFTLKGNLLYRENAGEELKNKEITIQPSAWQPGTESTEAGLYWDFAKNHAVAYKSLQMYLEENHAGVTADNVRFENGGMIDKSAEPLFYHLVDKTRLEALSPMAPDGSGVTPLYSEDLEGGAKKRVVVIVNNETDVYTLPVQYTEGLVIARGDVEVLGQFKGTILSGGTIFFATGAKVTADELMVSSLFNLDPSLCGDFQSYFLDYDTFSESVIGTVQIEEYLTYDNWRKNEE